MTVKEIIEAYLRLHGYDGLCTDDCGCFLCDLFPCDDNGMDCVPGHKGRKQLGEDDGDWGIFADKESESTDG